MLLEAAYAYASDHPDCTIAEALGAGVVACGGDVKSMSEAEAQRLAERIAQIQEADRESAAKIAQEADRGRSKPGVGTDYLESIGSLPMDMKCLYATGFNWKEAEFLYCKVDKETCDSIVTAALETRWKELKTMFESVIVGMGGDLDGDSGAIDASTPEGLDELRNLGF